MNFISFFAGIGGIDLGLERAGHQCVGQVEIDPYCVKVLEKHWPDTWRYKDITTLEPVEIPKADLWTGGFPCQPFSSASRGRRVAKDMWPVFLGLIAAGCPEYIMAENVVEKPIRKAEYDVQELGYRTRRLRVGAYEVGGDHKRNRWWLLAHANDKGKLYGPVDAEMALLQKVHNGVWGWPSFANRCRMADGVPSRMDRLKCLGNAVVPQVAEYIGLLLSRLW